MKNVINLPMESPVRAVFTMDGDYMLPYIRPGEGVRVSFERPKLGECGLFRAGEETLVRQYCADALGNVYLFALNRAFRALDRMFPHGEGLVCLGKLLLDECPPLPLDFGGEL